MFKTRRYTFKIYHKGTEFRKNDYPKLVKNNPRNLPLAYFLEQADNILRYEISFSSPGFNYLHDTHFFDSFARSLSPRVSNHPLLRYRSAMKLLVGSDAFSRYRKRSKKFTLAPFDYNQPVPEFYDAMSLHFDKAFFCILWDTFYKKMEEYQIQSCFSVTDAFNKIKSVNDKILDDNRFLPVSKQKTTLYVHSLIMPCLLIAQGFNLRTVYKEGLISKTTYYATISRLKSIGVTANSTSLLIPMPSLYWKEFLIYFGKFY